MKQIYSVSSRTLCVRHGAIDSNADRTCVRAKYICVHCVYSYRGHTSTRVACTNIIKTLPDCDAQCKKKKNTTL